MHTNSSVCPCVLLAVCTLLIVAHMTAPILLASSDLTCWFVESYRGLQWKNKSEKPFRRKEWL